ncbi:hypothetical protein AVEN_174115-1 [Araneus ventricosus]|uniref:Uncharacterized protein n=1 Tax=Araneus ventricosus TaxID=182803 RepID=A0A4Y2C2K5_ARAVE|nr:hypothetical protein AVEN_174115-1 [Araneus ventricosus]
MPRHINGRMAKALIQRRVAWPNFESLEVRTCGLWSVEFEQTCRFYGEWLCKYLGSAMQCSRLASLMCNLFTATTRETTDALTSPRATSVLPVPTTGNKANRRRNSRKDRPLERSLTDLLGKKDLQA